MASTITPMKGISFHTYWMMIPIAHGSNTMAGKSAGLEMMSMPVRIRETRPLFWKR